MSSCTGTLSTTDQLRADASISSLRSTMAAAVHGCPLGISCRAVTIPVAPVCLMSAKVIGSLGPNHRHVCSIALPPGLVLSAQRRGVCADTGHRVTSRSGLAELACLGQDCGHHGVVGRQ